MKPPKPFTPLDTIKELSGIGRSLSLLWTSTSHLPRGEGKIIVLFPGFMASPRTMFLMRYFFSKLGYQVTDWGLGKNYGEVPEYIEGALNNMQDLHQDKKLIFLGWSLGGYIAREVAREAPEIVEKVITFGTPVVGGPKYTLSADWYRARGDDVDKIEQWVEERDRVPLQVPVVAFYNPNDRCVTPEACIDHTSSHVEHIPIDSPHMAMAFDPTLFIQISKNI